MFLPAFLITLATVKSATSQSTGFNSPVLSLSIGVTSLCLFNPSYANLDLSANLIQKCSIHFVTQKSLISQCGLFLTGFNKQMCYSGNMIFGIDLNHEVDIVINIS